MVAIDDNTALLAVDLDGTLHSSDMARECMVRLCLSKPWLLVALPFWILQGRLTLKLKLAKHIKLDMARLAWNKEVIAFVVERMQHGQKLILATGAAKPLVAKAADHLTSQYKLTFDQLLAANETTNPVGPQKAAMLDNLAKEHGTSFDYIGDSPKQDPPVFAKARICHFVNPTAAMLKQFASDESRTFTYPMGILTRLGRKVMYLLQA